MQNYNTTVVCLVLKDTMHMSIGVREQHSETSEPFWPCTHLANAFHPRYYTWHNLSRAHGHLARDARRGTGASCSFL